MSNHIFLAASNKDYYISRKHLSKEFLEIFLQNWAYGKLSNLSCFNFCHLILDTTAMAMHVNSG